MPEVSKIRDVVDSVTGLVKAVPIYQDAIQPVAREFGVGAGLVMRAINRALYNAAERVWDKERVAEFLSQEIPRKLQNTPPERIVTPDPAIVGPVIHSLCLYGGEPTLRDLFASLLATAMDRDTADDAHPAFVEILRQLSPDEAKILRYMVVCACGVPLISVRSLCLVYSQDGRYTGGTGLGEPLRLSLLGKAAELDHHQSPWEYNHYIDNMCRLGVLTIVPNPDAAPWNGGTGFYLSYNELENNPAVKQVMDNQENCRQLSSSDDGFRPPAGSRIRKYCSVQREVLLKTALGDRFIRACGMSIQEEAFRRAAAQEAKNEMP